jgi:hypothetical protein
VSKAYPNPLGSAETSADAQQTTTDTFAHLAGLQPSELQSRWKAFFVGKVPARLGPEIVKRAIAYRLQEIAHGGLNRTSQLRLKAAMTNVGKSGAKANAPSLVIKPGTRFVRDWKGETHEVMASGDGSLTYRGEAYRSLSVIANQITGTHQSGPRFFGLNIKLVPTGLGGTSYGR